MSKQGAAALLSRTLKVDEIRDGASGEIAATETEMAVIARMLDLAALAGLTFAYRLTRGGGGRVRLTGRLNAKVTQTCVVSLDPVETSLDLPVEVEFWPGTLVDEFEQSAEGHGSHGIRDWPEAIIEGVIDLGPVVYETLATVIDPYPKREGVSFEWLQGLPQAPEAARSGPFAALAALKRR
jgi:uncharacterized protein